MSARARDGKPYQRVPPLVLVGDAVGAVAERAAAFAPLPARVRRGAGGRLSTGTAYTLVGLVARLSCMRIIRRSRVPFPAAHESTSQANM